jgi:hypothetical protein
VKNSNGEDAVKLALFTLLSPKKKRGKLARFYMEVRMW